MLVFGMGLVWLNIERVDMAYEITRLQGEIDQTTALAAKLEVERDTLITPGPVAGTRRAVRTRSCQGRTDPVDDRIRETLQRTGTQAAVPEKAGGQKAVSAQTDATPRRGDKAAKAPAKSRNGARKALRTPLPTK
jgi:hypothetical protein